MSREPPKKRTLIRGPVVAKVSLRRSAWKIDSRVFSSAHTPASPEAPQVKLAVSRYLRPEPSSVRSLGSEGGSAPLT